MDRCVYLQATADRNSAPPRGLLSTLAALALAAAALLFADPSRAATPCQSSWFTEGTPEASFLVEYWENFDPFDGWPFCCGNVAPSLPTDADTSGHVGTAGAAHAAARFAVPPREGREPRIGNGFIDLPWPGYYARSRRILQ
jgi:hypothetical protein